MNTEKAGSAKVPSWLSIFGTLLVAAFILAYKTGFISKMTAKSVSGERVEFWQFMDAKPNHKTFKDSGYGGRTVVIESRFYLGDSSLSVLPPTADQELKNRVNYGRSTSEMEIWISKKDIQAKYQNELGEKCRKMCLGEVQLSVSKSGDISLTGLRIDQSK